MGLFYHSPAFHHSLFTCEVVLSITDQLGWIDALILLLNLTLLGLLVVTRQRMIQAARESAAE